MPLDRGNIKTGQRLRTRWITDLYDLLNGAMTDTDVTLGRNLTVRGALSTIGAVSQVSPGPTNVPLTVIGAFGQSANLIEAKDSGGNVLFAVGANGVLSPVRINDFTLAQHNHLTAAQGGAIAGWIPLGEISGVAAVYNFLAIPQTYRHLLLVTYGRSDYAFTQHYLVLRLQGAQTPTYMDQELEVQGIGVSAGEQVGATYMRVGHVPGALTSATCFGTSEVLIPHYTQSNREKPFIARWTCETGVASGQMLIGQFGGVWDSAVAISTMAISPLFGSFTSDTVSTLYGMPS
jgi:hypothetical protein